MNILCRKYKHSLLKIIFKNEIKNNFINFIFINNFFRFSTKTPKTPLIPRSELTKMVKDKNNPDIEKYQTTSRGPGGQHTNKTSSAVVLKDKKTNISVKAQNSRDSVVNSGIANKRLVDKLDLHYNGSESKIAKKIEKAKKQKDRQKRKRDKKEGDIEVEVKLEAEKDVSGENQNENTKNSKNKTSSSNKLGDYNFFNQN